MNRRSILRLLGLAPIAAPAVVAAASKSELALIDYAALRSDVRGRLDALISFDGNMLTVPSLRNSSRLDFLPDGSSRFVVDANSFYITSASPSA